MQINLTLEQEDQSTLLIAGVDEAGRGPLAGPVVAAAVILDADKPIAGLNDSKKLSAKIRENLFLDIITRAKAYAISEASVEEIDKINILKATLLAMQRAIEKLPLQPHKVLIDGNVCPSVRMYKEAIIGGDALVPAISAASILAKVYRDRLMREFDVEYPGYGFARHAGYGTKLHLNALQKLGICAIHRKTYGPIKVLLSTEADDAT